MKSVILPSCRRRVGLLFAAALGWVGTAGAGTIRSSHFDGAAGVEFAYEARFNSTVAMTIEAWVYREDPSRCETIISQDFQDSFWLGFCPKLRFYRSGGHFADAEATVPQAQWSHVAASYDGATVRFYINGIPAGSRPLENNGGGSGLPVVLGRTHKVYGFTAYPFKGNLDEVRLWSVARTEAEIRDRQFAELRTGPGLQAVWAEGGQTEALLGHAGAALNTLPAPDVSGILPRNLVVPLAAGIPVLDGNVNLATEYAGAEQLVIPYYAGGVARDATAYLVHLDDYVQVGVTGIRMPFDGQSLDNSFIGVMVDPDHSRDTFPSGDDFKLQYYLGNHPSEFYIPGTFGRWEQSASPPAEALWPSAKAQCGEFDAPCLEFRISRELLGGVLTTDGLALGHFAITPGGMSSLGPSDAGQNQPWTWTTVTYEEGFSGLSHATLSGGVTDIGSGAGVPGTSISLFAGSELVSTLTTGALGTFKFDGTLVPSDQGLRLQMTPPTDAQLVAPLFGSPGTREPTNVFNTEVWFPGCDLDNCSYKSTFFRVLLPRPPITVAGFAPAFGSPPVVVRGGADPKVVAPSQFTLMGTNLHSQVRVFLSRGCLLPPTDTCIEGETYFEAPLISVGTNSSSAVYEMPDIPKARWGNYDLFAWDNWARPGVNPINNNSWHRTAVSFHVGEPAYPTLYGFEFYNQAGGGSFEEMTAVYEWNMFALPCVPWPHYLIWMPVYMDLANGEGSCVGMATTSRLLAMGELQASDFDHDAVYPFGLRAGGFGIVNPEADPADLVSGLLPPKPESWGLDFGCISYPDNLWAEICRNHGVQFSDEMIRSVIAQLAGSGSGGSRRFSVDGEPTAVLNRIGSNPSAYVVCMTPRVGSGHCVTPYGVLNNFRLTTGLPAADADFSLILCYDNNAPGSVSYIEIDRVNNQFRFPNLEDYSGRAISAHPISIWQNGRNMPGLSLPDYVHLLIFGAADAEHRDPDGGVWGWDADGAFHDEMDGGVKAISPWTGPNGSLNAYMFMLPRAKILAESKARIRGDHYGFFAAHHGVLLQLLSTNSPAGETDAFTLNRNGQDVDGFNYFPQSASASITPRVGLVPNGNESVMFEWPGLTPPKGGSFGFNALRGHRAAQLVNHSGQPAKFTLLITAADKAAAKADTVDVGPILVPDGAAHKVTLTDWPHFDRARLELDLDQDGEADEVDFVGPDRLAGFPPELTARAGAGAITLRWRALSKAYGLQETDALNAATTWTSVVESARLIGDDWTVTQPVTDAARFYRLRRVDSR